MRLANGLASNGFNVCINTFSHASKHHFTPNENISLQTVPQNACPSFRWYDLFTFLRQGRYLRLFALQQRPDIVISFIDTSNIFVLSALAVTKVPVVVSERTDWRYHQIKPIWKLLRYILYPFASKVVSLSSEAEKCRKGLSLLWNCTSISNPRLPTYIAKSRKQDVIPFTEKSIISVGRLSREKGHDSLIHAFSMIAALHRDWNLLIVGDGPLRDHYANLVSDLGLTHRVFFTGTVANPQEYMIHSDIFVLPSRYEGYGMVLSEALACGLPCIAFDCPSGPRQILVNKFNGILVKKEQPYALAHSIHQLITDSAYRQKLSQSALIVPASSTESAVLNNWIQLLNSINSESRLKQSL